MFASVTKKVKEEQSNHALTCGLRYSIHKSSLICMLVDVSFSVLFECTFFIFYSLLHVWSI